ncbi:MAG: pyruvate formate lyase-activating protein [Vallitaleaceae bacterium]|nr:pyruvate formate lyase-activating protein [Vallitaleaceae bacterium]
MLDLKELTGKVHSIETCGTVDGPGIRFVVFMQGCPLRCQFCHNPDTWNTNEGTHYTVDQIFTEVLKYKSYMKFSKGGITLTGGEPLLQLDFLLALFKKCKAEGIHTAIDTSGYVFNEGVKELLKWTDLVLLDVKNYDPKQYEFITGVSLDPTIKFLDYLKEIGKDTWIRYVLVPGLTDDLATIEDLADYLGDFNNVSKIEVLPFHKMGEYKWEALNIPYSLKDTKEPTQKLIDEVTALFSKYHDPVVKA